MNFNPTRRTWLAQLSAIGIGSVAFQRALAHKASEAGAITAKMVSDAQWMADIELTDQEKETLAKQLQDQSESERKLRAMKLEADTGPAMAFIPHFFAENLSEDRVAPAPLKKPSASSFDSSWTARLNQNRSQVDWQDERSIAASGILEQAKALREKKISSQRLTELYLGRLKRLDPILRCVVTLTEELAIAQSKRADEELAQGVDRGLLHGIPWGAKDIIAVPPFPTTWGARPYRDTVRPNLATVAQRLNDAGAVMLGKLSVGTLAMGDIWFDATTKNPWNVEQGSSGSSAGSCSAVAAGLCTFALGTETLGSIVSPARRCRVMGLRPSFGRVSRYGCMTLAWSMDKVGPIARHAIDCGIVLNAIQGTDGMDPTVVDRPCLWPTIDIKKLRVGYVEKQLSDSEQLVLDKLKSEGAIIVPIEFPSTIPQGALMVGLDVESGAMHDPLFRTAESDADMGLWGPSLRKSQFARGIHYVQSMRARTLLIQETERELRKVDVLIGSDDLLRTNLTGHPSMVVRFGSQELPPTRRQQQDKQDESNTPTKPAPMVPRIMKMTSKFFGDAWLVAVADYIEREMPAEPVLPIFASIEAKG